VTAQSGEPLDDTLLSLTVVNALEISAARREGQPMGTLDILLGVLSIDVTWGWESVQIEAGAFITEEDLSRFSDPQPEPAGNWHNVPLTKTATAALHVAAGIASRYKLQPMPGAALVLGLLHDPRSAASRALLAGGSIGHQELVALIQENVLDTNLEGLDLAREDASAGIREAAWTAAGGPSGARTSTAEAGPREAGTDAPPPADVSAAALARAQKVEGSEEPGALALLAAALEFVDDPDLADLLVSMLLDPEALGKLAKNLEDDDAPASGVIESARDRFGSELGAAELIVAAALADSQRLRRGLAAIALPPKELAGQIAEWRARQAGKGTTTVRLAVVAVLNALASVGASILLALSVIDSGDWWQLPLLLGIWGGYPKEGPVVGVGVAALSAVLAGPAVAAAVLAGVALDVIQASIERNLLWVRTGVRLTLRQQRHVVSRLLRERGRRSQGSRQLVRAWIHGFSRAQ
jgi:hypothetical protein